LTAYFGLEYPFWPNILDWTILFDRIFWTGISFLTAYFGLKYPYEIYIVQVKLDRLEELNLEYCENLGRDLSAAQTLRNLMVALSEMSLVLVNVRSFRRCGKPAWADHPPSLTLMMRNGLRFMDGYDGGWSCFNYAAQVAMADGSLKAAGEVAVGDILSTPAGYGGATRTAMVRGLVVNEGSIRAPRPVIQLGSLVISENHPVRIDGQWMPPSQALGAVKINSGVDLFNFVMEGRAAIVVEGFEAATIATTCPGLERTWPEYDVTAPSNIAWQSDAGAWYFESHPAWPRIRLGRGDRFLERMNHDAHAANILRQFNARREGVYADATFATIPPTPTPTFSVSLPVVPVY
jgi:hypothetical protein